MELGSDLSIQTWLYKVYKAEGIKMTRKIQRALPARYTVLNASAKCHLGFVNSSDFLTSYYY